MSDILVVGPESSGTRFVHRIVSTAVPARHRSLPHADCWDLGEHTHRVVVTREPDQTVLSALAAGHARTADEARLRYSTAVSLLLAQRTGEALWVSYEHLCLCPEAVLSRISGFLGVPVRLPEPIAFSWRS